MILIYGGKGYLGNYFCNVLKNQNINFVLSQLRADNYNDIEKEISNTNYTHVIDFIGITYGVSNNCIEYSAINYLNNNLESNI